MKLLMEQGVFIGGGSAFDSGIDSLIKDEKERCLLDGVFLAVAFLSVRYCACFDNKGS